MNCQGTIIVAHAALNSKTNLLHRKRSRQNGFGLFVPFKGPHRAVRQTQRRREARRQVALPIHRGHDDQGRVLHEVGVVKLRRGFFTAHQADCFFQLAIPHQTKSRDFQFGALHLVALLGLCAAKAEQQQASREESLDRAGNHPAQPSREISNDGIGIVAVRILSIRVSFVIRHSCFGIIRLLTLAARRTMKYRAENAPVPSVNAPCLAHREKILHFKPAFRALNRSYSPITDQSSLSLYSR